MSVAEYKHILRIAGKDMDGGKKIVVALSEIRGIGFNLAQVILQSMNVNPGLRVGFLTDKEIAEIETTIKNPARAGIPSWYLNRRKEMDTGGDNHLITSDLDFTISSDIEREKSVMSWRGYRHMFGLRVRGQCTRTTGRRGGAVGVKKIGKTLPTSPAAQPTAQQPSEGTPPPKPAEGPPASSSK